MNRLESIDNRAELNRQELLAIVSLHTIASAKL